MQRVFCLSVFTNWYSLWTHFVNLLNNLYHRSLQCLRRIHCFHSSDYLVLNIHASWPIFYFQSWPKNINFAVCGKLHNMFKHDQSKEWKKVFVWFCGHFYAIICTIQDLPNTQFNVSRHFHSQFLLTSLICTKSYTIWYAKNCRKW